MTDRGVDVPLLQKAEVQRLPDVVQGVARPVVVLREAVQPRLDRRRVRLRRVVVIGLHAGQVRRGVSVADHQQVVLRPGPDEVVDQRAQRRRAAVDEVVGGHQRDGGAGLDRGAEGTELVLVQHPGRQAAGGDAPVGLVVVRQEVLERGRGLHGREVAAQSPGVGRAHHAGQPGVLGVALLIASPAGVAQRVHHGRPDVEPGTGRVLVVERHHLVARRRADAPHQFGVPGARESDRLREDGRGPEPGRAVQGLGARAEGAQPEPRHRRLVLVQQADLLLQGEPAEEVGDPGRERPAGVAEGGWHGFVHLGGPSFAHRGAYRSASMPNVSGGRSASTPLTCGGLSKRFDDVYEDFSGVTSGFS